MLGELHQTKTEILDVLRKIADLATATGNDSLRRSLLEERAVRLEQERFNLVVLGEFNHGKTTFVNALLGRPLLPVGVTPTTAAIHHLAWADTPRAAVVYAGDRRDEVAIEELKRYSVESAGTAESVRFIDVGFPSPLLQDGVVLVDTPGVNDLNLQRAEITYSYIPRADAVIFLLDAGQILKESERIFLEERLLRRSRDKIFFVVNKLDLLTEPERQEALAYAREHLGRLVPSPAVYGVSSTLALLGEAERSGVPELLARLSAFLRDERGRVLLDNGVSDAQRAAAALQRHFEIRRRSLSMDEGDLDRRISAVEDELAKKSRRIEQLESKIRDAGDLLTSEVSRDLEKFSEALRASLVDDIKNASIDDIKKYLTPYIQDCFKRWAEQEGEKVGGRLEHLAEETIAVVNEDVKSTATRLADKVGIDPKTLDLNVDTLYYDVGVFALGAFGMSLMLLSNVLVGGILTLAAPLLAVVVREKVAREVRQRALESAPQAVSQAEAAVRAKFAEMIGDFTGRLCGFVAEAGEELHRGILEVLRRSREERRQAGFARKEAESRLDAQAERLAEIKQQLDSLRGRVWARPEAAEPIPPSDTPSA